MPGLDILFGQIALQARESRGEHVVEGPDRRADGNVVEPDAEQPGARGRVVEAVLAGEARRHHHAPDAVRAERIDRHGRTQRTVDAAGQA